MICRYAGTVATFIPKIYTHYAVTALFIIFGAKMLKEGLEMSDDEGAEELEEARVVLDAPSGQCVAPAGRVCKQDRCTSARCGNVRCAADHPAAAAFRRSRPN